MRRATLMALVILVALSFAAAPADLVAQTTPAQAGVAIPETTPKPAAPANDPYSVTVTEEMRTHQHWSDALYFAGALYGFLLLAAVLGLGISRRLRDAALHITHRPFLTAVVFFALFSVVMTVLSFPMDYFSGFVTPHRFNLSTQRFAGWLWDQVKGMLLGIVLGAPVVALALTGIRRVKRWWLAVWLGSVPITIFIILIAPVLLDPVFNKFEPLRDQKLKAELLDLASRAGISGGRVFEVDKSKQTTTMNAYVNGLGPTKRIVLWDTIISKMDHDELRFTLAHEMGHYVLHHVWKFLGFMLALLFAVFWAGQRIVEWATRRFGPSWGFDTPHDPAAVPLLLLVVSVFLFGLSPVINGYSRVLEHQADTFALELTHLNDAGIRAFVKFAEDSKVLPDPAPFIRFWRYSHPTLAERIVFCRSYKPWERGEPNRAWKAP
jgi:STE24 endopeptidase